MALPGFEPFVFVGKKGLNATTDFAITKCTVTFSKLVFDKFQHKSNIILINFKENLIAIQDLKRTKYTNKQLIKTIAELGQQPMDLEKYTYIVPGKWHEANKAMFFCIDKAQSKIKKKVGKR